MKMSPEQYRRWAEKLKLTSISADYINEIRNSDPVRRTQSKLNNVSGIYPSDKMNSNIQFESRTRELSGILCYEYDKNVKEYYDQPAKIKLQYRDLKGRPRGCLYTPDFLVLREDEVAMEEWKPEEQLAELAKEMPNRYAFEEGVWTCPPAEEYCSAYGIKFRLRLDSKNKEKLARNLSFLGDYYLSNAIPASSQMVEKTEEIVRGKPGITLFDLKNELDCSIDDLYWLVARKIVHVNLKRDYVGKIAEARAFGSPALAQFIDVFSPSSIEVQIPTIVDVQIGVEVIYSGKSFRIMNVTALAVTLNSSEGNVFELKYAEFERLVAAGQITSLPQSPESKKEEAIACVVGDNPELILEAAAKLAVVKGESDSFQGKKVSSSTFYSWSSKCRKAEALGNDPLLALIPRHIDKGNTTQRVPEKVMALALTFIKDKYENIRKRNIRTVYDMYFAQCKKEGLSALSETSFRKLIKLRPRHHKNLKRGGAKEAYKDAIQYWEIDQCTPRHGDYPFHLGHIDHTEIALELVCSSTGGNLGRAWLTVMISAYTREILAFYLTFDPPSYRSVLMVILICLKRHARIPERLVVDGGKEFEHSNFLSIQALLRCTIFCRPYGKPRNGSVVERFFGHIETSLFNCLLGNTQATKAVRSMVKETNPKKHAAWTLLTIHKKIEDFCYDIYTHKPHPTLGMSPHQAGIIGHNETGYRKNRLTPYSEESRFLIYPSTKKGTAKVRPSVGIKIDSEYYMCSEFNDPEIEESVVSIRKDPWNRGLAYACIRKKWVKCYSKDYKLLEGRSEREMQLASAEIAKRHKNVRKGQEEYRQIQGDFLLTTENEEILQQRLRDEAQKSVQGYLGFNGSTPEVTIVNQEEIHHSAPDAVPKNVIKKLTLAELPEFTSEAA